MKHDYTRICDSASERRNAGDGMGSTWFGFILHLTNRGQRHFSKLYFALRCGTGQALLNEGFCFSEKLNKMIKLEILAKALPYLNPHQVLGLDSLQPGIPPCQLVEAEHQFSRALELTKN